MRRFISLLGLAIIGAAGSYGATTIADTLRNANGALVSGSITISWLTPFTETGGTFVAAGSMQVQVVNGAFSIALYPNDTSCSGPIPQGSGCTATHDLTYTVTYSIPNYVRGPETWLVPTGGPFTIRGVIISAPPATTGVSPLFNPSQIAGTGASTNWTLCWNGTTTVWASSCGGASGAPQIQVDGSNIGSPRQTINVQTGFGAALNGADTGTVTNLSVGVNSAVMASKAAVQSGAAVLVTETSSSATVYTGTMTPTLTAYTTGMAVEWKFVTGCTGNTATTVNINSLGAKSLTLADGSTNPTSSDCASGRTLILIYDGTLFRIVAGGASSSSATLTNCWISYTTTVVTVAPGAAISTPCVFAINDTNYYFTASGTVTITAGSGTGTSKIYISSNGNATMSYSTGAGLTVTTGSSGMLANPTVTPLMPAGAIPLATLTIVSPSGSSQWGVITDERPNGGRSTSLTAGTGISTITNGVIATDPAVVPNLGAANTWTAYNTFGAGTFGLPTKSPDPGSCNVGDLTFNTTGNVQKICYPANTWTAVGGSGGGVLPSTEYLFREDFTCGAFASGGFMFDHYWQQNGFGAGSAQVCSNLSGLPGVTTLSSGTTSTQAAIYASDSGNTDPPIPALDSSGTGWTSWDFTTTVLSDTSAVTLTQYAVGFVRDATFLFGNTPMILFVFGPASPAGYYASCGSWNASNWMIVTQTGSATACTDTGLAVAANKKYTLKLSSTTPGTIAWSATNLTTTQTGTLTSVTNGGFAVKAVAGIQNTSTTSRNFSVDFFQFHMVGLAR